MLKNKSMHKITIFFLLALLAFSVHTIKIHAKASPPNSKIRMYPNITKRVSATKLEGEVQWKSSNPKTVSILWTKGNQAILKSGRKTGTCTITAKTADSTYQYKVTVKSDKKVSRATLVCVKQTKDSIKIRVKLHNRSNDLLYFGNPYYYERFENGKWEKVEENPGMGFTNEAYILEPKSSFTKTFTILPDKGKGHYFMGDFTPGTYRVHLGKIYKKQAYNYVIFTIK